MKPPILFAASFLLLTPPSIFAQTPTPQASIEQLGDIIKPMLIDALPKPLYESSDNWGHQANVPVGLKWEGLKATVQKSPRNHGEWRRTILTARNPKETLSLKVHDLKNVSAQKQTFKVSLTMQMGVEYEQQNWESGVRLWSGSIRARAQVKLDMDCEYTLRFEFDKNHLPAITFRARATGARLSYDHLVTEHINGIGGDAAKVIGAATHEAVKRARPSLERDLLAKANASIVKAADTREISLLRLAK